MPSLRRKYYTRPVPEGAVPLTHNGKPAVRFPGRDGKPVVALLSPDGSRCRVAAAAWYGRYTDAAGVVREVPLSSNKAAARQMLAELERKVELAKAGVIDRAAESLEAHARRPLADHLADWADSLRTNRPGEAYVGTKTARVRAVFDGCGWVFPGDLAADGLERFLSRLQTGRPNLPPLPAGVESFTKAEAAAAAGVSVSNFQALVRRHRLPGSGNGKARRFPPETVDAVRRLRDRGASVQTAGHYLQAVRQFARWMVDNRRLRDNPFARLRPGNVRLDQRRRRGELAPAEVAGLIAAARGSAAGFRGLSGADRAMLYRVALGTGLRAAELAALVPDNFELSADPPAAVLSSEHTKNRKPAVQPLAAELAADLRAYLRGRAGREPVWPGSWHEKAADMIRADLDAAGVPFAVDGPEGTEVRDFHALRVTYISGVLWAGADLKKAMTLARHSDPKLTTARYGRTHLHDLGAVVNKLPAPAPTEPAAVPLRATGTGGEFFPRIFPPRATALRGG